MTEFFVRSTRMRAATAFSAAVITISACTPDGRPERADSSAGPNAADSEVLATVGGEKITMTDVRARVGDDLDNADRQYKQFRSSIIERTLNSLVLERTLEREAKRQGKTNDELILAEAGPAGLEPTDAEIQAWYEANTARVGGRPIETIMSQIADLLRNQKRTAAAERLEARLNEQQKVAIHFEPYRLTFDNERAPAMGRKDAPVTLVEFSDFQCPYCRGFASTLDEVAAKYGDKVRIVYRQFPIPSIHPFAVKAAEASLCANDQGKFWELHDAMFANQRKLAVPDLKILALSIGLDRRKFDSCLDSGQHAGQVEKDMREGAAVGVAGTPAIFINGVELKGGALPFGDVARAIDRELQRSRRN